MERVLPKQVNVVVYREVSFFVCDYTGAFCNARYFDPKSGKGSFCCLPVMLRYLHEKLSVAEYEKAKKALCEYYVQPEIPLAEAVADEDTPMSESDLQKYLNKLPKGRAWQKVQKSQTVWEFTQNGL